MRKKLLAAIMSAAMVACASPVIALAEPVVDTETETTTEGTVNDTEGTDVTEETPVADEALTETVPVSEPAPAAEPGEDVRTGEITDQDSLEAAIAAAEVGALIDLREQEITLNQPLTVNKSVTIANGTLTSAEGVSGNLVTLQPDINVTLTNMTINTAASNRHALHAWGTNLTVNGLTINHNADGAPIVINNDAIAVFKGDINLSLGDASWYAINLDRAFANFVEASLNVTGVKDTKSVVCLDNTDGDQTRAVGVNLTEVHTTTDGGNKKPQIAYVADENLPEFVEQKTAAGADIERITLNSDVKLSAPLYLKAGMDVWGKNTYSFIGTPELGNKNVVTVMADGVSLRNVTIKTDAANKSALHIYKSSATLTNVTLDNTNTVGGAGMVVNAGTATVYGNLNILLGEKSWGGINIDTSYGNAGVTFADGSHVSVSSTKEDVQDAIYVDEDDKANGNTATVEGAEAAGLVQDADGNFVVKEETKPAEDNKPANDNKNDDKKDDKKDGASPKTGDSSALLIALMALAASGAAATVVVRKRNEMSR